MKHLINIQIIIGFLSLLLTSAVFAAPENDALNAAITIEPDAELFYTNTQNAKEATQQKKEKVSKCAKESSGSVWYKYKSSEDVRISFSTRGSDYDTVLSVWTGKNHPLKEIACSDNNGGLQSEVGVNLKKSTTYYINVSANEKSPGVLLDDTGLLILTMRPAPENDNLENAIQITDIPYEYTQETGGASTEKKETIPSCASLMDSSVWFSLVPEIDHDNVSFSTAGSGYDTAVAVWQGGDFPLTELICSDNALVEEQASTSYASLPLEAGIPYYISVGGVEGESGELILKVKESQRDFNIATQPAGVTIQAGETATLTVEVSNLTGKIIETGVENQWENETAEPYTYEWFLGDPGNTTTLLANSDSNTFTTPALDRTTRYWVRVGNPTGRINSEAVIVTIAGTEEIDYPDDSTTDDNPDDPATDDNPDDPATDNNPDDPATDDNPDDPATDNNPDDPATDDNPDDPATDDNPTENNLSELLPLGTNAVDNTGQPIDVGSIFSGGISVESSEYLLKVEQNLSESVDVLGHIEVDPDHVGETVDVIVYAETTFPDVEGMFYYMLENGLNIVEWNQKPENFAGFKYNEILTETYTVPMYAGTFYYPGTLKIFFGYRLANGTVVLSSDPIDVTINE